MADEADRAQILEEAERDHCVKVVAKDLAKGEPGDCRLCGDYFERLVMGACGPCREQAEKDARLRRSRMILGD